MPDYPIPGDTPSEFEEYDLRANSSMLSDRVRRWRRHRFADLNNDFRIGGNLEDAAVSYCQRTVKRLRKRGERDIYEVLPASFTNGEINKTEGLLLREPILFQELNTIAIDYYQLTEAAYDLRKEFLVKNNS